MRNPKTVSGRVWVEKHFQSLRSFLESGRRDGESLREAGRALQYLLQRDPDYAPETRQLALHFVMGNWNAGWPDVIADAVRVGTDADLAAPDLHGVPAPAALLFIFLAETRGDAGDRLGGLAALDRAQRRLGDAVASDALAEFVRARVLLLRAELQELERETGHARASFQEARDVITPLMADDVARRHLVEQWTLQVFGPQDSTIQGQAQSLGAIGLQQFEDTYVRALMGQLRTTDTSDVPLETLVEETRAAIGAHGLGRVVHPFLMFNLLARLAPDAQAFGEFLAESSASAKDALLSKGMLNNLDPKLVRLLKAQLRGSADDDRQRRLWELAARTAMASALERRGELESANEAYHAAFTGVLGSRMAAVAQAFILGTYARFLILHSRDVEHVESHVDLFLAAFEAAWRTDRTAFVDLRFRGLFDDLIAEIVSWKLLAQDGLTGWDDMRLVSVLLDLLRVRDMPPVLLLSEELPFDSPSEALKVGFKALSNTLHRIAVRLTEMLEATVLITHDGGPGKQLFVMVNHKGLSIDRAGPEFDAAAEALEGAAELAVFQARAGLASGASDPLGQAARKAFCALPERVRDAITTSKYLLIAPDYRSRAPVPYELLHDGRDYLLATRVIARFASLRHLARTLDAHSERPALRRALVVAAPNALPARPLYTAAPECTLIRDRLQAAGFDAPEISDSRLNAAFFTDRLSYVDTLHVAAHGESKVGLEFLALPNGRRLSVDDLLARRQRSVPFVYLNTCQLGRTRYLGGGQSRGLAFTLSELGAPAVLANTTNTLDDVATDIATSFYEDAMGQPVGWALLAARQRLMQYGTHPALVGRVILYGDPHHRIAPATDKTSEPDATTRLLDIYFDGREESERRLALEVGVTLWQRHAGEGRMAAAMNLIQTFAQVGQAQQGEEESEAQFEEMGHMIALADELHHAPARAVLRYVRARLAGARADGERERGWIRDAITHLAALPPGNAFWDQALVRARAEIRRREMHDRGLEIRYQGPGSPDVVAEAMMDLKLATEHALEEEVGPVAPRPVEDTLDDILWNAVVAGHPNRFEDTLEASAFCRTLVRKLEARGYLRPSMLEVAHPMVTGLLWYVWSIQKNTSHLAHELVQGHAGTVGAMVRDITAGGPLSVDATWRGAVLAFPSEVDRTLTFLESLPWEKQHIEIGKHVAALASQAKQLLENVASAAPGALAGVAAFVSGTLAVKNVYTPLEGNDDMHEQLTAALDGLSRENEARFMAYLTEGFEVCGGAKLMSSRAGGWNR